MPYSAVAEFGRLAHAEHGIEKVSSHDGPGTPDAFCISPPLTDTDVQYSEIQDLSVTRGFEDDLQSSVIQQSLNYQDNIPLYLDELASFLSPPPQSTFSATDGGLSPFTIPLPDSPRLPPSCKVGNVEVGPPLNLLNISEQGPPPLKVTRNNTLHTNAPSLRAFQPITVQQMQMGNILHARHKAASLPPPPAYLQYGQPHARAFELNTTQILAHFSPDSTIYHHNAILPSTLINTSLSRTLTILLDAFLLHTIPDAAYTPSRLETLLKLNFTNNTGRGAKFNLLQLITKAERYSGASEIEEYRNKEDMEEEEEHGSIPNINSNNNDAKTSWKRSDFWNHSALARNIFLDLLLATKTGYIRAGLANDEQPLLKKEEAECACGLLFSVLGYGDGSELGLGDLIDRFLVGQCDGGRGKLGGRRVWGCEKMWKEKGEMGLIGRLAGFGNRMRKEEKEGSVGWAAAGVAECSLNEDESYFRKC